jgi:hypothetical protein
LQNVLVVGSLFLRLVGVGDARANGPPLLFKEL